MKTSIKIKLLGTLLLMVFAGSLWAQQAPIQFFRPWDQGGINVFETSKQDTIPYDGFKFRIGAGFTQGYQNLKHSNNSRAILTDGSNVYIQTAKSSWADSDQPEFIGRNDVSATPVLITGTFSKNPNAYGTWLYDPDSDPNTANSKSLANSNALYEMAGGFPLAQANLNFDVQIADGVRLSLVSYMSSHHHNEFWVKGGFFQIDKVGFMNSDFMNKLWTNLTLKVGHMEVNYGDAHFRRSDGGNTLYNPFMENNILDAFTTEIGAELYWQKEGFIVMAAMTDGEVQGNVTKPDDRSPSIYGKFGWDKQINDNLRVRLTMSGLTTKSSVGNTLYGGDRTGSNYQFVMDPTTATVTGNFASGRFNPGYRDNLKALVFNPFVKFRGFEFFGTFEQASGNTAQGNGEVKNPVTGVAPLESIDDRKTTQSAVDLLYRFGQNERFYVGAKYNVVKSEILLGTSAIYQGDVYDVSIDRTAIAAGWFITPKVMFKAEYVVQKYNDYPAFFINKSTVATFNDSSPLAGGKFNGFVVQGVISF
jgi:hypothetical protein